MNPFLFQMPDLSDLYLTWSAVADSVSNTSDEPMTIVLNELNRPIHSPVEKTTVLVCECDLGLK